MTNPIWKSDASTTKWQVPFEFSIGFPTDADVVTGTPATHPGGNWFEAMAEEIRNVIVAAGLDYDPSDTTQFYRAIVILFSAPYAGAVLVEPGNYVLLASGEHVDL